MRHDTVGGWTVYKPDSTLLSTTGTTTSGLQEAINYAVANGWALEVYGGWLGSPTDLPKLSCTTAVNFPVLALWSMRMYGVNVYFTDTGATDGFVFDSCDLTDIDMGNGQIFFQPSGAAIHFNPTHDNGEDFIGITSSIFRLPIVAAGSTTGGPQQGTCVRFSMPYTAGHALGSGLIVNNRFDLGEINGGHIGLQVDNPASPNTFNFNHINAHSIHGQDQAGVKVGTSALAADLIYGNQWKLSISEVTTAIEIWGGHSTVGGDIYDLAAGTATILGSSATNNLIRQVVQLNGTLTNNATAKTNKLLRPGLPTRAVITVVSGTAIQNVTMMPCSYVSSGGTVTVIAISADGITYDPTGETVGSFYVPAGGWIKWTHTGAPTVTQFY